MDNHQGSPQALRVSLVSHKLLARNVRNDDAMNILKAGLKDERLPYGWKQDLKGLDFKFPNGLESFSPTAEENMIEIFDTVRDAICPIAVTVHLYGTDTEHNMIAHRFSQPSRVMMERREVETVTSLFHCRRVGPIGTTYEIA